MSEHHPCTRCHKRPNLDGYWHCQRCIFGPPWAQIVGAVVGAALLAALIYIACGD